ncbi:hypothetical protein ACROYT_G015578 [Oculina patagonica]
MKKHADVLGKEGDHYKTMNMDDKNSLECLIKRANKKTMVESQSHELSNIEDEYHSDFHSGSDESTGEETQPENLIDKEVEQVCQRLQERDGECVINPKDDIGEVKFLFMSSLDPSYIPIQKETSTKGKSKTQ